VTANQTNDRPVLAAANRTRPAPPLILNATQTIRQRFCQPPFDQERPLPEIDDTSASAHGRGLVDAMAYRPDTKAFLRREIERKEKGLESLRCLERLLSEADYEPGSDSDCVMFEAVAALVNSSRL